MNMRLKLIRKVTVYTMILVYLLSCTSNAQYKITGDTTNDIESFISNYIKNERIPGMGLLYYSQSTEKILVSSGVSNLATQKKIDSDTVYDIGSTTKVFISFVILQLEAEGKLSLDSKVGTFIKDLTIFENITIRELLNHTSSIPDYFSYPSKKIFKALEPNSNINLSFDLLLESSLDKQSTSKRGEWQYSNTNYLLLGQIIEEVTGNSIGTELLNRIFSKYDMNNTFYMPENKMIDITNIATGYQFGNPMSDDKYYYFYNSAGGIVSTLGDMYKFANYLISNTELYEKFEQSSINCKIENTMHTKYGLGIIISEDVIGQKMSGHGGTTFGFKSEWWFSIETGEVLILYANSSMYKKNFFSFRKQLANILKK